MAMQAIPGAMTRIGLFDFAAGTSAGPGKADVEQTLRMASPSSGATGGDSIHKDDDDQADASDTGLDEGRNEALRPEADQAPGSGGDQTENMRSGPT
jgi:hypothetical protein